ncbi:triose-phosphate isomerase [soil metagenome]
MSRRRLIVGNWKMHTSRGEAVELATALRDAGSYPGLDLAVCPPYPWIEAVGRVLSGSQFAVGAQDCWHEQSGAFTGQVAPAMLAELCSMVILGHSEHRRDAGESDELVGLKAAAALDADLTPIICVGESIETRQSGDAQQWVGGQVAAIVQAVGEGLLSRCIFAYEPIWAIGSGIAAGGGDAQEMAAFLRETLRTKVEDVADGVRILYGGSVTGNNAASFASQADVDGLLVGGASLRAGSFLAIADAC